jgi:endonuclease V-like protein UPF0215 family
MASRRPHLVGIDDGPFTKGSDRDTPLVAVLMEGCELVEAVATARFPIDGDDVSGFLARWIGGLRFRDTAQGLVFGGLTIAGLAVLDLARLARDTGLPVFSVNRREPSMDAVAGALRSAGLGDRIELLASAPRSIALGNGLHVAVGGGDAESAHRLLLPSIGKSTLPEPLRVAHLIAAALARGESRGRA